MTGQWHGGKGSRPKSFSVDQETFASNWERTFGKKDKKKEIAEDDLHAYDEERLVSKFDKETKDADQSN